MHGAPEHLLFKNKNLLCARPPGQWLVLCVVKRAAEEYTGVLGQVSASFQTGLLNCTK